MQNLVKFTDYEVYAYLIAGLTLMVGLDLAFGWEIILRRDGNLTLVEGAVRVFMAYVLGSLLDNLSWLLLQRVFGGRIAGHPFGFPLRAEDGHLPGWRGRRPIRWLFSPYHEPAKKGVREEVVKRLRATPDWKEPEGVDITKPPAGWVSDGWYEVAENVFYTTHPAATRDPVAQARMELFLKLYGGCRNLGFVLLLCAVGFFVQWRLDEGAPQLGRSSDSSGGVTVVIVPAEATAARVTAALKEMSPKTCGPFAPKGKDVPGCGTLPSHGQLALGSALIAFLLILRFLHFHRMYALEVLTAYSREKLPGPAHPLPPAAAILAAAGTLVAAAQAAAAEQAAQASPGP